MNRNPSYNETSFFFENINSTLIYIAFIVPIIALFLVIVSLTLPLNARAQDKITKPYFHRNGNDIVAYGIEIRGDGTDFPEDGGIDTNNPPVDESLTRMFSISVENWFNNPDGISRHGLQKWAYTVTLGKEGEDVHTWGWIPVSPTNEITHSERTGSHTAFRYHSLVPENVYINRKGYPFGATIGDKIYFRTVILDQVYGDLIEASDVIQVEVTDGYSWGEDAEFSVTTFAGWLPPSQGGY